tara:strand:- start:1472 stop:1933 length:462 start_codon:yes stop_codon:yes gene_type:complete
MTNENQTINQLIQCFPEYELSINRTIKFSDAKSKDQKLSVVECITYLKRDLDKAFQNIDSNNNVFWQSLSIIASNIMAMVQDHEELDEFIGANHVRTEENNDIYEYLVFAQQQVNKCFEIYTGSFSRDILHYIDRLADIVFGLLHIHNETFNQ